ncbi:MAG: HAD family hydrolase [Actinomycetota bacterium]|nr:HAD family hydrolase [Actinomycetota bacterium]MDZ4177809.1 HAD family hydrolase [Coriobacteriia bacterium]
MKAVLFDLDGTLLDINLETFLRTYFTALAVAVDGIADDPEHHSVIMRAIHDSTGAMMRPHEPKTNREAFAEEFEYLTGFALDEVWPIFEAFYADVFPGLGTGMVAHAGAHDSLATARRHGLRTAVATNPIFPRSAVVHRMEWAGILPTDVDIITDFETMLACKPHATYYRQTAEMLGVDTRDCLMVGDDAMLDLAAADVGMRTFYVGSDEGAQADYRGTLVDLAELIERSV